MHRVFFHRPLHVVLKHWRQRRAALLRVDAASDSDMLLSALPVACFRFDPRDNGARDVVVVAAFDRVVV